MRPTFPEQPVSFESGFHIVEKPISRDALLRSIFREQIDPAFSDQLLALNPHLKPGVRPGQMLIFSDPRSFQCRREHAQLMQAAREVDEVLKDLSDEEAEFLVVNHQTLSTFLGDASTVGGPLSYLAGAHLETLQHTLKELERLHIESFRSMGVIRDAGFMAQRQRLLGYLKKSMNALVVRGVGLPDYPEIKTILGIGDRKLVHRWAMAGGRDYLPGYATQIGRISKSVRVMKAGGYVAIGLGIGASAVKIHEVCRWGESIACRKVRYSEGGKMVGTLAGGLGGGYLGTTASVQLCAGIPHPGGHIACLLVIGAGVSYFVGEAVGQGGQRIGEVIYEGTGHVSNRMD